MTLAPTRSRALAERMRGRLTHSLSVRFIREASDGRLTGPHFARYLAIEEEFVKTAARVNAFTLFAEPEWARVPQHAAAIRTLLVEQLDYFRATRETHSDDPENIRRALERSSSLSHHVMAVIDEYGYAGAVVCMFTAETLYSVWCTAAAGSRQLDTNDSVDAWIALHATPEFGVQADSLGQLVDRLPTDEITNDQLDAWFTGMLDAEDDFHDSIYFPQGATP